MTWLQYNEALQELAPDSELVVGSGAQATWRVRKADLMPRHFIVRTSDGGVRIRPFSSDAVVAVNGRQVSSEGCELEDGDVVSAGSAQIDYWSATPGKRDRDADAPVPVGHLVDAGKRSAHVLRRVSTGIGRDESNSLVVEDPSASRFHAEIRSEAGGHALRVMGAAGVKVNGRPVTAPMLLTEADEIAVANLSLRYTRNGLPAGVKVVLPEEVRTTSVERAPVRRIADPTPLGVPVSPILAARSSMRYVAVFSLLAAVAAATLLFLHRLP